MTTGDRETQHRRAWRRDTKAEPWRSAMRGAGMGAWDIRPDTGALEWDSACAALFGAPPHSLPTLSLLLDALHPDDRARVSDALTLAATETGPLSVDCRLAGAADAPERWIALRGGPAEADGRGDGRLCGVAWDVTEEKAEARAQALMMRELSHRVKNTVAMVQAMASRTLRSATSLEEGRNALTTRLVTLSKAQDILTAENWEGAEMGAVVSSALAPFREGVRDRFNISGPFVRISPPKALALFMALHELATNAVKHGALSAETGRIALHWDVHTDAESRRLRIIWRESGGPPVTPPTRRGFGASLLQQGLTGQFGASVEMDFRPQGLWCTIDTPLLHLDRKTPQ